ncbi:MAG: hypothetical protein AB7F88_01530 [Pyrinomonadaceae bacterium]
MKSLLILANVMLVAALTQQSAGQFNDPPQSGPTCGTDVAMAKMSNEQKSLMTASAVAAQSDELLLYINFNPNGSVVRSGFGNADTLTTPLVSGQRFCPAPLLDEAQRDEIVRLVSDDYSPFNIRVTTDAAEFAAHPRQTKQMVLITTVASVIGHSSSTGGVSPFSGLGLRLPGDFAFVFSSAYGNDPRSVAAVVSHESGHFLGLGHQHLFTDTCGFLSEYHGGFGSGPLSFNPLMGDGTGEGISNWFAQSCPSPTFGLPQNDYELINSQVVVRPDDFPDEPEGSVVEGTEISGVLEGSGDADLIKINFRNPGPVVITSDNIDLKVSLLNPGGRVMAEFNDPGSTDVTIPFARGMKYLKIEAASNENMSAEFMTGTYHVSYGFFSDLLAFFDASAANGSLTGVGSGGVAQLRLNLMRLTLVIAGELIEEGRLDLACFALRTAHQFADGAAQPDDLVTGAARPELADRIQDLQALLGCL